MSDFFVASALAPIYTGGAPVVDEKALYDRVTALTDAQILAAPLDSLIPFGPEDDREYAEYVREEAAAAVRDVILNPSTDTWTGSFGGGKPVILTGGPSSGDDPTHSFAAVSLMGELGLFNEPFTRP